jgi:hypothetical protein
VATLVHEGRDAEAVRCGLDDPGIVSAPVIAGMRTRAWAAATAWWKLISAVAAFRWTLGVWSHSGSAATPSFREVSKTSLTRF